MRAQTRHQLKQDKFSKATLQVAEQTVHWTVEHKNRLIASAVVLLVLVAAALGAWYYMEQQDAKASVDFSKGVEVLDAPVRLPGVPQQPGSVSFASSAERAAEARKRFQAVVNAYPHTRAADFAHYLLGVTAAELGDNAASERELKTVAAYRDADLASLARLALASLYTKTNRPQQAIEIYKQLIQKPTRTVGKSTAEIQLAETYRTAGLTAEAKKQYEQIQKEAPQSEAAQVASGKLEELK